MSAASETGRLDGFLSGELGSNLDGFLGRYGDHENPNRRRRVLLSIDEGAPDERARLSHRLSAQLQRKTNVRNTNLTVRIDTVCLP